MSALFFANCIQPMNDEDIECINHGECPSGELCGGDFKCYPDVPCYTTTDCEKGEYCSWDTTCQPRA